MLLKKHGDKNRSSSQPFGTESRSSSVGSSCGSFGSYGSPPARPSMYGIPGMPFPRDPTSNMSSSLPHLPTVSLLPERKNSVERLIHSNGSSKTALTFEKQFNVSKKKEELRSQLANQLEQESKRSKNGRRPLEMRKTTYREQTADVTTTIRHQQWAQQLKIPPKDTLS